MTRPSSYHFLYYAGKDLESHYLDHTPTEDSGSVGNGLYLSNDLQSVLDRMADGDMLYRVAVDLLHSRQMRSVDIPSHDVYTFAEKNVKQERMEEVIYELEKAAYRHDGVIPAQDVNAILTQRNALEKSRTGELSKFLASHHAGHFTIDEDDAYGRPLAQTLILLDRTSVQDVVRLDKNALIESDFHIHPIAGDFIPTNAHAIKRYKDLLTQANSEAGDNCLLRFGHGHTARLTADGRIGFTLPDDPDMLLSASEMAWSDEVGNWADLTYEGAMDLQEDMELGQVRSEVRLTSPSMG